MVFVEFGTQKFEFLSFALNVKFCRSIDREYEEEGFRRCQIVAKYITDKPFFFFLFFIFIFSKVIQLSWISSVYQLNQLSTSLRTSCGRCCKLMFRCGWSCDRCHTRRPSICSLCQQVVKGMFAWCQGCGHGGHINHIQSWLRNNKYCPAGCGHICEY